MAKVLVNETSLTGIADAIREKNGTAATYKPAEMAAAITAIETGAEDKVPKSIVLTGDMERAFYSDRFKWVLENYVDRITTYDLKNCPHMFAYITNKEIPFDLDFKSNETNMATYYMFYRATELERIGKIKNLTFYRANEMFSGCQKLKQLPEFENCVFDSSTIQTGQAYGGMFAACHALRSVPSSLLRKLGNVKFTGGAALSLTAFNENYALDEVVGLSPITGTLTSNVFSYRWTHMCRLKRLTFLQDDNGQPYKVSWKGQTIDLHNGVGWLDVADKNLSDYSGIGLDKKVSDAQTYEALKNDPDWYTSDPYYSRFNHDSAVEFINSLPDASDYLATQSSATNTLVFRNVAGAHTDGGSIGSLTEEEIAVAAAKGWTITYKT